LSYNIVPNGAGVDYIRRKVGYYIIIILNIIGVKLNINAADYQDCGSLGNMVRQINII
jgi:hypothetical protein